MRINFRDLKKIISGSDEITPETSGFYNAKKTSVQSHYNLLWQRILPTKYPAMKQKKHIYLSMGNQSFS
jgi:hypothetical protein